MKKLIALISCLALAACGGGSGGSDGGVHTSGSIFSSATSYRISHNSERNANSNNSNITGMTSSIVTGDTDESRAASIARVATTLGDSVYTPTTLRTVATARSATTMRASSVNGSRVLTDEEKYYIAYHKLEKMEKTLKALDAVSGDDAEFAEYVSDNKSDVIEAFRLMGQDVDKNTTVEEYATLLTTVKDGGTLAAAIGAVKPFSTVNIDEVQFKFAGEDKYAKFVIDEHGVITKIAKYDSDGNISDQGFFDRDKEGAKYQETFTKQMRTWKYNLGDWTGAGVPEWFSHGTSGKNNIITVSVLAEIDAEEPSKDDMIAAVNRAIDKFASGQDSEPEADDVTAVKNHYATLINNDSYTSAGSSVGTYVVELNGLGRTVGLKYSDFGYAKMQEPSGTNYSPYSGGYSDLKLGEIQEMEDKVVFNGKAIAGVEISDSRSGLSDSMLLQDNGAKLELSADGTTSTLTMSGLTDLNTEHSKRDWYTVTITDTPIKQIMNFDPDGKADSIDDNFKFAKADAETGILNHEFVKAAPGVWNAEEGRYETNGVDANTNLAGVMNVNYYSSDGNQENMKEAGATFYFGENQHWDGANPGDPEDQRELSVYGAFGGLK